MILTRVRPSVHEHRPGLTDNRFHFVDIAFHLIGQMRAPMRDPDDQLVRKFKHLYLPGLIKLFDERKVWGSEFQVCAAISALFTFGHNPHPHM